MIRQVAKHAVERMLGFAIGHPARMMGRSLILAYHNVVPDQLRGLGDQSLHLPLSAFLKQLDLVQTHCSVKPLADLLTATAEGRPRVAITFDDAYRGAVELALPELARRGLPATLFVAPGLLGARSFWWDELASENGGLPGETRQHALDHHAGRHGSIRAGLPGGAAHRLPDCYGCALESEVRAISEIGPITLGAHSWSHPNLARLEPEELVDELERPLDWLRAGPMSSEPMLAYPYGLSSPEVETAAARAGYAAGLLVEGGWMTRPGKSMAVPRFNVPAGLSIDGLLLRLAGRFMDDRAGRGRVGR